MELKGRAGDAHLSVSALGPPPSKQLSQEHRNSHFLWGPRIAAQIRGPENSAWSPSLGQEILRMTPSQDPACSLASAHCRGPRLANSPLYVQGNPQLLLKISINQTPEGTKVSLGAQGPSRSYQSHEADSPQEPQMTGSKRRTKDCRLFNLEPTMCQLAPSSSLVPPNHLLLHPSLTLPPGQATCRGNGEPSAYVETLTPL